MRIQYLGHSSFLIKTKEASILTDPFDPKMTGLKFPKVEADIITVSHQHRDHNQTELVEGKRVVFDFPGEYESRGVRFYGYQVFHDDQGGGERGENIIFKIIAEGITVVHCGDLGHMPANEILAQLDDVDILMVPVGGIYTIDAKTAKELGDKLSPKLTIPMHYLVPAMNQETFGQLAPVSEYLKLAGKEGLEPVRRLDVKAESMPENETAVLEITS